MTIFSNGKKPLVVGGTGEAALSLDDIADALASLSFHDMRELCIQLNDVMPTCREWSDIADMLHAWSALRTNRTVTPIRQRPAAEAPPVVVAKVKTDEAQVTSDVQAKLAAQRERNKKREEEARRRAALSGSPSTGAAAVSTAANGTPSQNGASA